MGRLETERPLRIPVHILKVVGSNPTPATNHTNTFYCRYFVESFFDGAMTTGGKDFASSFGVVCYYTKLNEIYFILEAMYSLMTGL